MRTHLVNCACCGNLFKSNLATVKVCTDCKNRPCEICGKPFNRVWPFNQKACSEACRKILRVDPERLLKSNAKRSETVQANYGVSNIAKLSDTSVKIRPKAETIKKKECKLCGKLFNASGSKSICDAPHYRRCVICGTSFEFNKASNIPQTCSRKCSAELRKQKIASQSKICEYCNKPFTSTSNNTRFCSGPHFSNCLVCGNQFEVDLKTTRLSDLPKTCSHECAIKLSQQTSMERYGVPSPCQTIQARQAAREAAIQNQLQREMTCLERYGVTNPAKAIQVRNKISQTISNQLIQQCATMQYRYGVNYAMQSSKLYEKQRTSMSRCLTADGTVVDSSWEAIVYEFLTRNNIQFEYNSHSIPFEYNNEVRVTHIDFKVGDLLLEVKSPHLLEGVFDTAEKVPISKKLELYKQHHVVLVTSKSQRALFGKSNSSESNGLKYLNKCPEPLIGSDIDLFDHPEFPYRSDRPQCFYNVKVDGKPSSFEAFFNESIRWKMILNRINYTGGFVDSNQILIAMNVTRTCKQPSWFSKSLATRLIEKYCTSDTIVDSFAGWGTRHDAAKELGKQYIGIDLNPELIDWHTQNGRTISLGDATKFVFAENCSVFICPPYSDPKTGRCFEDYNFDRFTDSAKSLSQCDWLRTVMKNIPNANEYVMVCKIVDRGFEKYVTETLTNSSHLGKNHEYVIVVKNKDRLQALNTIKEIN